MKNRIKKLFSALIILLLVLLIISALFVGWFYISPLYPLKAKIARAFPALPAAMVGGQLIPLKDVLDRQAVSSSTPEQVLAEVIAEKQTAIVANKYGVSVSDTQLNNQLAAVQGQPGFLATLGEYHMTTDVFKNNVLKPQLLYNNLRLWFNSQRPLNPGVYAMADNIKQQLAQSTASGTFTSLVAEYSQDNSTKSLDGNLGFVEVNSLWPEFQGAVESAEAGSIVVAPGSDGLYIFQIQAKDNSGPNNSPRAELSEIYLQTGSFQNWYNNEIKNIKIKKLI